jgi:hypothetical protein
LLQSMLRRALAIALTVGASASQADETAVAALPHLDPIQLTYRALDPQRTLINEQFIVAGVGQAMTSLTRWPVKSAPDTKDAVIETGGRTQLNSSKHLLVMQYLANTRYLSGGSTGTTLTIPVAYTVERSDELVKITLTFPDQGTVVRHGLPFLTRKLWDMQEITNDYAAIAGNVQAAELPFNYQAHGEFESKLKPDAVLGNLERLLARPARGLMATTQVAGSGSVSRDETFVCSVAGNRREVQVSTFPYHDGTKISYTAVLPYKLKADGSVSGGEEAPALAALLAKIIDD